MKVVKRNMSHLWIFESLWILPAFYFQTIGFLTKPRLRHVTRMNPSMWSVKTMVHRSWLQDRVDTPRWMKALSGWWTWLKLQKACPWTTYRSFTFRLMARTYLNESCLNEWFWSRIGSNVDQTSGPQFCSWRHPKITHFVYLPYLTHSFQTLESLLTNWWVDSDVFY